MLMHNDPDKNLEEDLDKHINQRDVEEFAKIFGERRIDQGKMKRQLYKAFLKMKDENEVRRLLFDLFMSKGISKAAQKLKAAEMLAEGRAYSVIEEETGLSSATVANIQKCIKGGMGGYRLAISKPHTRPSQQPSCTNLKNL